MGVNDALILKEFAVINQGFFDEWEFVDANADLKFEPDPSINNDKYACLKSYFIFLENATNQKQPWGLLNGMRPIKLVHGMKKQGIVDKKIYNEFKKKYAVSSEKLDLILDIANHQLKVIPNLYHLEKEVSIYIGIPFCPTRCAYCTFSAYAYAPNQKWVAPFLDSLLTEIKIIGHYLKEKKIKVTSIYIGGGTPTILSEDSLKSVLTALYENIASPYEVREITVEAGRPDTITREKLKLLKEFHVNRLSINPQSFNQKTLDKIGRHHLVEDVIEKFNMAKDIGIKNINMDLIVGLPDEKKEELLSSLAQIRNLQPESLTVHMLAFKRKSEISNDRKGFIVASKNVLKAMAQMTYEFTKQEAYVPYYLYRQKNIAGNMENIGYSKAGCESVYNILMMEEAQNILGLGVQASSKFLIGESMHNPKDLKTYIQNYETYAMKKLELLESSMVIGARSFTYNPPV